MEREPLLRQSQQDESPTICADLGTEIDNEDASTLGILAIVRKVFNMQLLAVMIGFFMAGICSSSIGVCDIIMYTYSSP